MMELSMIEWKNPSQVSKTLDFPVCPPGSSEPIRSATFAWHCGGNSTYLNCWAACWNSSKPTSSRRRWVTLVLKSFTGWRISRCATQAWTGKGLDTTRATGPRKHPRQDWGSWDSGLFLSLSVCDQNFWSVKTVSATFLMANPFKTCSEPLL